MLEGRNLCGASLASRFDAAQRLAGTLAPPELEDALASCRAVSQRATQIFEWRKLPKWNQAYDSLLDIALDHLTLGRAALYATILEGGASVPEPARR